MQTNFDASFKRRNLPTTRGPGKHSFLAWAGEVKEDNHGELLPTATSSVGT